MTDYTKTTNFTAKDGLTTGDSAKIVRGSEMDTEFDNLVTAVATKHDTAGAGITVTSNSVAVDINGLAAITPLTGDELMVADASNSYAPSKVNISDIVDLVGNTTDIDGLDEQFYQDQSTDTCITYDNSAGSNKKIKIDNLQRKRVQAKSTGAQLGTNWKQTHTYCSGSGQTFEVPLDSTYDFDNGTEITFFSSAATNYIDVESNSTTLRGPLGLITTSTRAEIAQGGTVVLRKLGNDFWSITGDYTV